MTTRAVVLLMSLTLAACGASGTATRTDGIRVATLQGNASSGAPGARVGSRDVARQHQPSSHTTIDPLSGEAGGGGVVDDTTSEPTPLPIDEPGRPPVQ